MSSAVTAVLNTPLACVWGTLAASAVRVVARFYTWCVYGRCRLAGVVCGVGVTVGQIPLSGSDRGSKYWYPSPAGLLRVDGGHLDMTHHTESVDDLLDELE